MAALSSSFPAAGKRHGSVDNLAHARHEADDKDYELVMMTRGAPEIDLIDDPEQIRCLSSARRHDILARLLVAGSLSVRELAEWLGAKPSALYHHIQQLADAGLIRHDGHRVVNRRREQLYVARSPRMRLSRDMSRRQVRDSLGEVVASFSRQAERDFRRGLVETSPAPDLSLPGDAEARRGFARAFGRPGGERLKRINALLDEAAALMTAEDAEGGETAVVLSWALTPATGGED